MDGVYWGEYEVAESGIVRPVQPDQLSSPQAIAVDGSRRYTAVGNAWSVYRDDLSSELFECITDLQTDRYPEALAMLPIAQFEFVANQALDPIHARPHYLRNHVVHINTSGQ